MSILAPKVFALVFLMIAVVGFVGIVSFININNHPVDATINTSLDSYYNTSQVINQTMNDTLRYGKLQTDIQSPMPLFIAITVMGSALFLFLVVVSKKGGK